MASTISLQSTVNWAMTQTKMIPIVGVGGFGQEPALTICNNVIFEIFQEPYNWKWNSVQAPPFSTSTAANTQDYPVPITDCAWLESCTRVDLASTQQPQPVFPVSTVRTLPPTSDVGIPEKIAFMFETSAGVTMRLWPIPNLSKQWQMQPVYQRKGPVMTNLSQIWPTPDEMAAVVRQGFLAMAYRHADDARADKEYVKFVGMIQKAASYEDLEADAEGFYPDYGLFL